MTIVAEVRVTELVAEVRPTGVKVPKVVPYVSSPGGGGASTAADVAVDPIDGLPGVTQQQQYDNVVAAGLGAIAEGLGGVTGAVGAAQAAADAAQADVDALGGTIDVNALIAAAGFVVDYEVFANVDLSTFGTTLAGLDHPPDGGKKFWTGFQADATEVGIYTYAEGQPGLARDDVQPGHGALVYVAQGVRGSFTDLSDDPAAEDYFERDVLLVVGHNGGTGGRYRIAQFFITDRIRVVGAETVPMFDSFRFNRMQPSGVAPSLIEMSSAAVFGLADHAYWFVNESTDPAHLAVLAANDGVTIVGALTDDDGSVTGIVGRDYLLVPYGGSLLLHADRDGDQWVPFPTGTSTGAGGLDEAAVQALVGTAIDDLLDGAPGALNTLNELAAALGDDASFAASVTTALAGKQAASAVLTALAGNGTPGAGGLALLLAASTAVARATLGLSWVTIADVTNLSSGSLADVTVTGYRFIRFRFIGASAIAGTSGSLRIRFNSDTGNNYSLNAGAATSTINIGSIPGTTTNTDRVAQVRGEATLGTASTQTVVELVRTGMTASTDTVSVAAQTSSAAYMVAAAVTTMRLFLNGGENFQAGSRLIFEGIA